MEHKILARYPLGNPRRTWRQDNFILSTFQCKGENMRDAMENIAETGLNLLEMGWCTHEQAWEAVHLAEELQIDIIFQDFSVFGGMQERNVERSITPAIAREVANKLRPWKHVIGYYVWDEPFHDEDLKQARAQIDMLLAEDPTAIAFSCAIPSYNSLYKWENGEFPAYLRRYADMIEPPALSLDYYPIGNTKYYSEEAQLDNSLFWYDLEMMRKVCREKTLPLWFYHQTFDRFSTEHFIYPMARMMMYAAVMYGAKGLQNFTAPSSITNSKGAKGRYFNETKEINAEFIKLGNTLMALDSKFVIHSDDLVPGFDHPEGKSDKMDDSTILCGKLPTRISVGELWDEYGNKYLLVLNRDYHKEADISLDLKEASRIYLVSKVTGRQELVCDSTKTLDVKLAPGDGCLYRIQNADEEAFTVEYRIEK